MEGSKIGYQDWIIAIFQIMTSLKSVSSMKLHRDLGITQKSAWFLAQRLRAALSQDGTRFHGPVEVDETYFGGRRRNMSNTRRKALADTGRGPVGKIAVVGAKDRRTKHVAAKVVHATDQETLQGFVEDHAAPGATVYTDDATAYESLRFNHATIKHSLSEYVKGDVHTNGIESLWSMIKRAHKGTFHKLSPKHLDRYVQEFAGRHNVRELDTIDQLAALTDGMDGKRLTYDHLIAENGLPSGRDHDATRQADPSRGSDREPVLSAEQGRTGRGPPDSRGRSKRRSRRCCGPCGFVGFGPDRVHVYCHDDFKTRRAGVDGQSDL